MKSEHLRRGRKPLKAHDRKDRIVQTRVPEQLDEALREAAEQRQMSVSQLIRHLLEDTFQLVDTIVADSASLVDTVTRDAKKIAASAKSPRHHKQRTPPHIDAWQPVVLNRVATCYHCRCTLAAGSQAWQAVGKRINTSLWCCDACMPHPNTLN